MLGVVREEMPRHMVVHKAATYEVRRYSPSVIAECSYGDRGWGGGNDGSPFGALARYIGVFGTPQNNAGKAGGEKIAMTAPVLVTATATEPEPIAMTAPVLVSATEKSHTQGQAQTATLH